MYDKLKNQGNLGPKPDGEGIRLGDIEDYAMGFRLHAVKLFMFGVIKVGLSGFESKVIKQILKDMDDND